MNLNNIYFYWWLIFPMSWIVMELVRMILRAQAHGQKLALLKSYAQKGETPPQWLMDALNHKQCRD